MSDSDTLILRLRNALVDADGAVWDTPELQEALLQALADMRQAAGQAYSVDGLGGAAVTSLPPEWFDLLVRGAAAYAMLSRAADRVDAFNFDPGLPGTALTVSAALMQRFVDGLTALARLRISELQTAPAAPYPDGSDLLQPGWKLPGELESEGG